MLPFILGVLAITPVAPARAAEPLVVTTSWLAAHLHDKNLVLMQIGDRATRPVYDSVHIPGAQFLAPLTEFSKPRVEGALTLELPSVETLDSIIESKGISNDSHVVLYYARGYFTPTSRALFTLEYMGLAGRVSVLDGGFEAWQKEGRPVTAEIPAIMPGRFTPTPHPELVADAEYVKSHLEDKAVRIVDARDTAFYGGSRPSQNGKSGHIPGAVSIYFGSVVDSAGKFLPESELASLFAAAGVKQGETVVTYCHIGQQASFVWLAARRLGYTAKLYDGSMQDWTGRADFPVVLRAAAKPE